LILSKLYRAKDSQSEIQLRDSRNLLSAAVDTGYLSSRAAQLGIDELLDEVLTADE